MFTNNFNDITCVTCYNISCLHVNNNNQFFIILNKNIATPNYQVSKLSSTYNPLSTVLLSRLADQLINTEE